MAIGPVRRLLSSLLCAASVGLATSVLAVQTTELTPQQIYERTAPAVVFIIASPEQGTGMGGTGSIVRSDGLILTNAHVVMDKATKRPYPHISVFLRPERVTGDHKSDLARRFAAHVVAVSATLDLAVLRVEGAAPLPVVPFGDPRAVRIGDRVLAIGHPEQGGLWTLTSGVISAEFENFEHTPGKHVFQTDTGLNRGNSGGPLLDSQGQMIGINTAVARLAPDGTPITSISFAIDSMVAQRWLQDQGLQLGRMPVASVDPPVISTKPPAVAASPAAPASPPPKPVTVVGPQGNTEPHPYDMDRLLKDMKQRQMKEMEDMIGEMREKLKRSR